MRSFSKALITAFGVFSLFSLAQAGDQEKAKNLFQEGISLFQVGKEPEALAKFQESLQEEPSAETAYDLFRGTENRIWLRMLSRQGEFERVAVRMMKLAKVARAEKKDDSAAIQALIEQLRSDRLADRRKAIHQLSFEHGEFAAAAMSGYLNSQTHSDIRIAMMNALVEMGKDSVLPIGACLQSSDPVVRRSAAMVLGRIRDTRSLAALKQLAENDSEASIRNLAHQSLSEMNPAALQANAHDLFCDLGEAYAQEDPRILDGAQSVIWRYDDNKQTLVKMSIPASIYASEMARQAFANALRLEPVSQRASAGIALAYGAQIAAKNELVKENRSEEIAQGAPFFQASELGLAASGVSTMNTGLVAASQTGENSAAAVVAEALGRIGIKNPSETPQALVDALQSPDRRVRYAAAISLARMGNALSANAEEQLVGALSDAVALKTPRIVHLIDENKARRNKLAKQLENAGYSVSASETGAMGLVQFKRYGAADLILLSTHLSDLTTEQMLGEILEDTRTQTIPVFLISEKKAMEKANELYGSRVKQVVDGSNWLDLQTVSEAVATRQNPDRESAEQIAKEAASALSEMDSNRIDLTPASIALLEAVQSKPDLIAIPAARALGKAATPTQCEVLGSLLAETKRSKELRIAIADGLGQAFSRLDQVPNGVIAVLFQAMREDTDNGVRQAAAAAIGRARISPADRAMILSSTIANNQSETKEEKTENSGENAEQN